MSDELQDLYGDCLRYWTIKEIQTFCIEHGLVIAEGIGRYDEAVITERGRELWRLLTVSITLEEELQ